MNRGGTLRGRHGSGRRGVRQAVAAHRGLVAPTSTTTAGSISVTTSLGGPVEVWRNAGPAGHWLRVVLRGRASNRDGLGAIVIVDGQPLAMTSATGYASSVLQGVHVGLGTATAAPRIEVRWPSGRTQSSRPPVSIGCVVVTEPEA